MPNPSPSTLSLNSNFLQFGSGGRPQRGQFTPMRLPVNTVIHTTLVGLEPATFRSLVSDVLPVVPPSQPIRAKHNMVDSGTKQSKFCWTFWYQIRKIVFFRTWWTLILSPSIGSFCVFLVSTNRRHVTDGRTDLVQHLMLPPTNGHTITTV